MFDQLRPRVKLFSCQHDHPSQTHTPQLWAFDTINGISRADAIDMHYSQQLLLSVC